jgi:hypothetical protein
MNSYSSCSGSARFPRITGPRLAGLGLALGLFAGCANDDAIPLIGMSDPTPELATTAPRTAKPTAIVVRQAPPPSPRESIMDRPSVRHVWVTGYWVWQDDKYQWTAGHWEMPPRGMDSWVAPRWEKKGDGYVLSEGFWR